MAIRIREIEGHFIAICAAQNEEKEGDIYLHDGIHHALTTKLGIDFKSEGFMNDSMADPVIKKLLKKYNLKN